ncbi:MAG: hypothetical protein ACRDQZ_15935 [Mycobacteriales bacterium]
MVVANEDDTDGGDLYEVHGAIRKTWHRILGWRDNQPNSPGEMKSVLTSTVSFECVKSPR